MAFHSELNEYIKNNMYTNNNKHKGFTLCALVSHLNVKGVGLQTY